MPYIFIIIFLLIFFRVLGYAHKKIFPNQDSGCDITCQSPSSKHYHFKKTRVCWTARAKCSLTMAWYNTPAKERVAKVYLWNAIVTKHLALTIWHSNIYWNDNVLLGWWLTSDVTTRILVLEDFFCGRIQVLWRKLTEKFIIKYMAHI